MTAKRFILVAAGLSAIAAQSGLISSSAFLIAAGTHFVTRIRHHRLLWRRQGVHLGQ